MMLHILGGRLGQALVESQARVLDVATGTGIWATQYGARRITPLLFLFLFFLG
jgi:hypothetical protein